MSKKINRGKKFEDVVKSAFERIFGVSIDRVHDQTTHYKGSTNVCDFIVYKFPRIWYIECKSVHGSSLSIHSVPKADKKGVLHGFYGNITDAQWQGLLAKSEIRGVIAGVLCWWVDKDTTAFIPIQLLEKCRNDGAKSFSYREAEMLSNTDSSHSVYLVAGKKKRVFFDYDMKDLLEHGGIRYGES